MMELRIPNHMLQSNAPTANDTTAQQPVNQPPPPPEKPPAAAEKASTCTSTLQSYCSVS